VFSLSGIGVRRRVMMMAMRCPAAAHAGVHAGQDVIEPPIPDRQERERPTLLIREECRDRGIELSPREWFTIRGRDQNVIRWVIGMV